MIIKYKKLSPKAIEPQKAHESDACFDLFVAEKSSADDGQVWFGSNLAFEIPSGYVGLIFPRSSIYKSPYALTNGVGVIDSGYRGEIKAAMQRVRYGRPYEVGERFAQIMFIPLPAITLEATEDLSESDRGGGGFGSSGA